MNSRRKIGLTFSDEDQEALQYLAKRAEEVASNPDGPHKALPSEQSFSLHSSEKTLAVTVDAENYTIGHLIEALRKIEAFQSVVYRLENQNTILPGGSEAVNGYFRRQGIFHNRTKIDGIYDQIPSNTIDIIKPICEAKGNFDTKTLEKIRGMICLAMDVVASSVDAMSAIEFSKEFKDANKGDIEWSPVMSPAHLRKIFAVSGVSISQDTLKGLIESKMIPTHPGSTSKLYRVDTKCLPPGWETVVGTAKKVCHKSD